MQVRAIVVEMSSEESLIHRLQENEGRQDLAPIEFARQVAQYVDTVDKVQVNLAHRIGCSPAKISRAYDLGSLPSSVISAFKVAKDLQYRYLVPLKRAIKDNEKAVLEEAARIGQESDALDGPTVLDRLMKAAVAGLAPCKPADPVKTGMIISDGKQLGTWQASKAGGVELTINVPMSDAQRVALAENAAAYVGRKVLNASGRGKRAQSVAAMPAAEAATRNMSKPPHDPA